jgi:hypothetical protein
MNSDKEAVIRRHLESLETVLQHLKEAQSQPKPFNVQIGMKPVKELMDIAAHLEEDMPGVAPAFKPQDYVVFKSLKGQPRYENLKIQAYINDAVGCLNKALEA